jgi:hypothetical protein
MKTIFLLLSAFFLLPSDLAYAGSATWNLNPGSGDWNTAANWTPATVPNGPNDVATFGASNTTAVSTSLDTTVNGIVFKAGSSAFTISLTNSSNLTISGAGVTNQSGVVQNFVALADSSVGSVLDMVNTTPADQTTFTAAGWQGLGGNTDSPGIIAFDGTATAGNAT